MAIFERPRAETLGLDDTLPVRCLIENAHTTDGHTEYIIKCRRGFRRDEEWTVSHRFSEFAALDAAFRSVAPTSRPPLPKKKIIGNMNPDFVAERRNELQTYLDAIEKIAILRSSFAFKMFIDPRNYSQSLHEIALQNVSMALRGEGSFQLKGSIPAMGWRIRKYHFAVSKNTSGEDANLMTWLTYGPDKVLSDREMKSTFKSLISTEHPFVDKLAQIQCLESGTYVIKNFYPNGSVKDQIYATQYKNTYLSKYAEPKLSKPFTIGQISYYGYQILHALKFLHQKGWPYGHLHTGNIAIENQKVILMDLENSILGVPSKLRHFLVKHKKICSMESVDVYSFGHVLYELTYGRELLESTCDSFANSGSADLTSVLVLLLSPSSCKSGMPNTDYLLSLPFFNASSAIYMDMVRNIHGSMKVSSNIKENLKKITERIENRLKNDQKLYIMERKQLRIQEILSSEEEIQKRKHKVKAKENDLYRSKSLNGITSSSTSEADKRSESVNSSLSTGSSHQSHSDIKVENGHTAEPKTGPASTTNQNRTMLLDSICSFNKDRLNRVK